MDIGTFPLLLTLAGICVLLITVVLVQTILFAKERSRLYAMVTQKPVSFFEPGKPHPATDGESKPSTGTTAKPKRVWVENVHEGDTQSKKQM